MTYLATIKQLKSHSTEGSPERSGYMHMDKQVTHSILIMLFSMRGTETAKVEGLWLVNRPKCLVPENPDNSPKVQVALSFYSTLPQWHERSSWCHLMTSWSSALIFQLENHRANVHQNCCCSSVHLPASMPEPQILQKHLNLFVSFSTQFSHLWHTHTYIYIYDTHEIQGNLRDFHWF